MTTSPRSAMRRIEADLRIDVDGQRASLVGQGQRLTLTTQAPGQLLSSLRDAALPSELVGLQGIRTVGRLADALDDQGLEFHFAGPDGDLVHLGAGAHSWWGWAVFGSSRIRVPSIRAAGSIVLPPLRRVLGPAAIGLGLAAAGAIVARSRHGYRRRMQELT